MSAYEDAIAKVDVIADWSPWARFTDIASTAPTMPGVYMFRSRGKVIYVGIAGPRDSNGRKDPAGLYGRFSIYRGGRVTGFGQALFDAALADHEFLAERQAELQAGLARRAVDWVRAAYEYYDPDVRWAALSTKLEALQLEKQIVETLRGYDLLNREAIRHRATMKRA